MSFIKLSLLFFQMPVFPGKLDGQQQRLISVGDIADTYTTHNLCKNDKANNPWIHHRDDTPRCYLEARGYLVKTYGYPAETPLCVVYKTHKFGGYLKIGV